MCAVIELLEQRMEKCALRFIQACRVDCIPNCRHFFDIDNKTISEQDIERRYRNFRDDPKYHPK